MERLPAFQMSRSAAAMLRRPLRVGMNLVLGPLFLAFASCSGGTHDKPSADSVNVSTPDSTISFEPIDTSTKFLDTFSSNLKPWLEQTIKKPDAQLKDFRYADNWVEDSLAIRKQ